MVIERKNHIWLALLILVIGTNIAVYNTPLFDMLQVGHSEAVVLGSLLDLLIIAPILTLLYIRKFSAKVLITVAATGCVLARLAIPSHMLAPYELVTFTGIAFELVLIGFELTLLGAFFIVLPKIVAYVKVSHEPLLFAYSAAVDRHSKSNQIVRMLSSELIVFYYAFASWKKQTSVGITLHKNTSFIASQLMMIHAIAIESIGIHWWLHSKAPVLSIILLFINVYGIIFFLGDLQAMRLNSIKTTRDGFYISLGLMKRAYIKYADIDNIILENEQLLEKKRKDCVEFIVRDFEKVFPQLILQMKNEQTVEFIYGFKKQYRYVAIKSDAPAELLAAIRSGVERTEGVK